MQNDKTSYNTDIEMVMDFMRLAVLFNDRSLPETERSNILMLEKAVIDLLPIAQSHRMASIYALINKIYEKQQSQSQSHPHPQSQSGGIDHFIVLFYRSTCPACQKIMNDWENFKKAPINGFTTIQFDGDDISNRDIFKYFKVNSVPTIFKLQLDRQDYIHKLEGPITYESLTRFARS